MAVYSVSRSAFTLSTADDMYTLIGASGRRFRILEVSISGNGATSAAAAFCEVGIYLSTGGTTSAGTLTPKKWDTNTATAATAVHTGWTTDPSLSGDPYARIAFNNYGGIYQWRPPLNGMRELVFHGVEQCSIRATVGTSAVSSHVIFEEI